MAWLPYHHDWRLAYQITIGIRLHWFDRYAGTPDWKVETSRLAADMVSFFFVERNSCWAVVNGRRLSLKRGDLLVVLGGDEFSLGHDPARPHVSLSAAIAFEHGGRANALLYRKFQRCYHMTNPEEYVQEFETVMGALRSTSPFRDLAGTGAVLRWLSFLLDRIAPPMVKPHAEDRNVVEKVLSAETWATGRLKQVITLADWAKAVRLSPVYFGRIFKRETGLRPMDWLNQQRLQLACHALASTNRSVGDIAEDCGFANPFYFSRVFRRHFGQSPIRYRKSQS
jgi:AraC-like DNA-binding protein